MDEDRQPLLAASDSDSRSSWKGSRHSSHASSRKNDRNLSTHVDVVFVVSFDTKKGNVVEWSYPKGHNLEGLEFKSLASGLHTVQKDFIYFRYLDWYGLSCYEKMSVPSEEERGVRMRCVGVLAEGYHGLGVHMDFLRRQVRRQLEHPAEYGSLEEYARHHAPPTRQPSPPRQAGEGDRMVLKGEPLSALVENFLAEMGPSLFVLWKLVLLQKRILFYSSPPIGASCLQVYLSCLMTPHGLSMECDTDPNPQFYISVSDIDLLRSKRTYIACTTEHIMQSKEELFDVLVAAGRLSSPSTYIESLLTVTRQDQARFRHLQEVVNNSAAQSRVSGNASHDHGFKQYFEELNGRIFATLEAVSRSADHVLTVEHLSQLGLDPSQDRRFVADLALLHGFDATVQRGRDVACPFNCV